MLTELYIEVLLVDEDLSDRVWRMWDSRVIDSEFAVIAWLLLRPQDSGVVRIKSG